MSRTSRYAFILAKVYGVFARSWLGKNYRELLRLKKLSELYDQLFPGERPESPVPVLAVDLEARIVRSGIAAMTYVLRTLGKPVEILVHILRRLEYQSLKTVIRGMMGGPFDGARIWDLGEYAGVRLAADGDNQKAIHASPYAWVLPLLKTMPLAQIENMLDRQYYERLLQLASALPKADRPGVIRFVAAEITLVNVIWALRLRFFFGMDAEKAQELLIPGMVAGQRAAVAQVFDIAADSVEDWRKWKFAWLVADQLGESFRAPDPVRAEQKASQRLYERARHLFHQNPFTLAPLVAYFALKEREVELLKTAVEALRLSLPEQEVMTIVGAQ